MSKKALYILGLFYLADVFFLVISCGPTSTYYLDFNKINVQNFNSISKTEILNGDNIYQKDFQIDLELVDINQVSKIFKPAFFIQSANAFSQDRLCLGLKHKIIEVKISCDKELLGIEPGNNLESKLTTRVNGSTNNRINEDKILTINQWIDAQNRGLIEYLGHNYFDFTELLNTNEPLIFEIFIKLDDGRELIAQTKSVVVE